MKRLAAGSAVAVAMVVACVSSDPLPSVPPTTDAGTTAETGSSGSTSGTGSNVLPRGTFEEASCLGWEHNEATKDLDKSEKHEGEGSCRVCIAAGSGTSVWGIYQDVRELPKGTYTVLAYVHPSGTEGPEKVAVRAQALDAAGQPVGPEIERTIVVGPNDPWQSAKFDVPLEDPGGITLAFLSADIPRGCFLVDDATITLQSK